MTIDQIKEKVIPIAKEYNIPKIAIFGSAARGDSTENSDIDFLIEKSDKIRDLVDLSSFSIKLEKSLNKPVDVVTYKGLEKSIMRESILENEVIIYEKL